MVSEFGLIERYFSRSMINTQINRLGGGDDCALMAVPAGYELAITTDTMVEGVHFFAGANPRLLGHKLLAVNFSDLAAMGAEPVAVTLALTLPTIDEAWLKEFSEGFQTLAEKYSVDLVGGDTTSGPLTLTVQAMGLVPEHQAIKRSGAQNGDLIFVTGQLGGAGLGLKIESGDYSCVTPESALEKFHQPEPRIDEGLDLRGIASACIDLSDGIAADLKHILKKSEVGARLDWDALPVSEQVKEYMSLTGDWQLPLAAGEDYELCFTVNPEKIGLLDIACTQVGVIEAEEGLRLQRFGKIEVLEVKGFEHFC